MIGILGGTFDPIHYGHLRPAHEVFRRLEMASLRLIPASTPPHRQSPFANASHRLRMVELAAVEFPGVVVDDREIRRGGVSYTVSTLESLRAEVGDAPLCLLVGSDAFAGLPTWHRWEILFDFAHFVVMERPGAPLGRARAFPWAMERISKDIDDIAIAPGGRILFVPVTPLDISATRLRETIGRGETPSPDELPAAVWKYIVDHHLYRSPAT